MRGSLRRRTLHQHRIVWRRSLGANGAMAWNHLLEAVATFATDLPCAAGSVFDFGLPCAVSTESRSKRRRLRERRVAIRHAQRHALDLKRCLDGARMDILQSTLNADASAFFPSLDYHGCGSDGALEPGVAVPARRVLRGHCVAQSLPVPPVVDARLCRLVDEERTTLVSLRKCLRDPGIVERLPTVPVPDVSNVNVVCDSCDGPGDVPHRRDWHQLSNQPTSFV